MRSPVHAALFTALLTLIPFLASPAGANPTSPIALTAPPDDQGAPFVPGVRLVENLKQDYVEEEFLVAGAADLYSYAHNPPLGPTDLAVIQADVPYQTRMIVRRPAKKSKFKGTVVIEWWNSTAGFDTAPAWDPSAEYFAREGIVYVGVTNSTQSLGFLTGGCRLFGILPPTCGTRYATLSLPENGLAYDMMSQIANAIRQGGADSPLPEDFNVKRIFHAGESQQGGSMITYASGFHHLAPGLNDGYFIQAAANARPINFGLACGEAGSPPFPSCTPRLVYPDSLLSTNLEVPAYQVVTQTDVEVLFGTSARQPDTPTYRYYEVAGGAHLTTHLGIELIPAGIIGPDPVLLEDLCQNEINTTADGPVYVSYVLNALWQRMHDQVHQGKAPPPGVEMDGVAVLDRDANGNVLGGIRLPSMEAPTATYGSSNIADPSLPPFLVGIGNLACFLGGSVFPFDDATLAALYPDANSYVNQVLASTKALEKQKLLLKEDAKQIKDRACAAHPEANRCN